MESGQLSTAVGANKEINIFAGVHIECAEIGPPGEFEAMSDDELLAAIRERSARLQVR
jgi:formylmethanofuran dehydrogenase subunit A